MKLKLSVAAAMLVCIAGCSGNAPDQGGESVPAEAVETPKSKAFADLKTEDDLQTVAFCVARLDKLYYRFGTVNQISGIDDARAMESYGKSVADTKAIAARAAELRDIYKAKAEEIRAAAVSPDTINLDSLYSEQSLLFDEAEKAIPAIGAERTAYEHGLADAITDCPGA